MDKLQKRYLYLTGLLTSSSEPLGYLYQKVLIILLIGLILIGFGVLAYKTDIFLSGDKVEVLNNTTEDDAGPDIHQGDIIVEIAGAVEKVGVYSFKEGSRVDDVLIASGGLSVDADRDWVEKNINRASKLTDGQKIYIYSQSEVASAKTNGGIKLDQGVLGDSVQGLVNINTASQSELEKLIGIGPVYAQSIIEHRPYSNTQELVSKKIIPQKTYEKIKSEISL